jgi:hypothetical protein
MVIVRQRGRGICPYIEGRYLGVSKFLKLRLARIPSSISSSYVVGSVPFLQYVDRLALTLPVICVIHSSHISNLLVWRRGYQNQFVKVNK